MMIIKVKLTSILIRIRTANKTGPCVVIDRPWLHWCCRESQNLIIKSFSPLSYMIIFFYFVFLHIDRVPFLPYFFSWSYRYKLTAYHLFDKCIYIFLFYLQIVFILSINDTKLHSHSLYFFYLLTFFDLSIPCFQFINTIFETQFVEP